MTNPTPHGQMPEALRLAHIFDNPLPPEWPDMVAAAAELRRQHARIAELEAQIKALSGMQALSAAPAEADMFWDAEDGERFGNDIDDIISDFGPGDRVKINCAKRMPSIEVLVIEDGDDFTYQVISPTPPAEQQAPTLRRVERTTFPNSPAHRATHAFVSAMHDNHIKGDDMRAAMLWFLGYEECDAALQQAAPKAAPGEPQNCERCCGSGEDPAGYYDQSRGDAGSTFGGPCRECNGTGAAPQQEAQDATVAAFEVVRKKLCALPRYSFVLDDDGLVRRVEDRTGNWIEFDDAHELFDPVAIDAALAEQGGKA